MERQIRLFLDTLYNKPLTIHTEYWDKDRTDVIFVSCDGDSICHGVVINYAPSVVGHINWDIPYELHVKIQSYMSIPDNLVNNLVMSWVRMRCEYQGIYFAKSNPEGITADRTPVLL